MKPPSVVIERGVEQDNTKLAIAQISGNYLTMTSNLKLGKVQFAWFCFAGKKEKNLNELKQELEIDVHRVSFFTIDLIVN